MPSTERLLSIKSLKKYFPVDGAHLFQKGQLYLHANEEITLDIMRGETLGLVGESGCGKSTLGRTVLQLYTQTAGTTMYYGHAREDLDPRYLKRTLKHAARLVARMKRDEARCVEWQREWERLDEDSSFFRVQRAKIDYARAVTRRRGLIQILGGFAALDDPTQGARWLYREHESRVREARLRRVIARLDEQMAVHDDASESPEGMARRQRKKQAMLVRLERAQQMHALARRELSQLRDRYRDQEIFMRYEGMRDGGIDLSRLRYDEMRVLRRELQIVFQDPYSSLNPRMTVGQIIEEGLVAHGYFKRGDPRMQQRVLEVMEQCGLQEYMRHRYPHQFSGGQRQRICIARALAVNPSFVVCDECVSALDVSVQAQIINLLRELKRTQHLTYLFISHDLSVVRYLSDRIGVMYLGHIVELCESETLFLDPRHPYTIALLCSVPSMDPDGAGRERILAQGNMPSPTRPPRGCKYHTRCFMACDRCREVEPPLIEVEAGHLVACHFPERKMDAEGKISPKLTKSRETG